MEIKRFDGDSELLAMLKERAEIAVPDSLSPENIRRILEEKEPAKRGVFSVKRFLPLAACLAVLAVSAIVIARTAVTGNFGLSEAAEAADSPAAAPAGGAADGDGATPESGPDKGDYAGAEDSPAAEALPDLAAQDDAGSDGSPDAEEGINYSAGGGVLAALGGDGMEIWEIPLRDEDGFRGFGVFDGYAVTVCEDAGKLFADVYGVGGAEPLIEETFEADGAFSGIEESADGVTVTFFDSSSGKETRMSITADGGRIGAVIES